jgi:hypothetical protein
MNRVIQPPRVPMTPDEDKHEEKWQALNEVETLSSASASTARNLLLARAAVVKVFAPEKSAEDIVKKAPIMAAFNRLADAEMDLKDAEKVVQGNAEKDEKDREEVNILPLLTKVKKARTDVKAMIEKTVEAMSRERPSDEDGPAKKVRTSAQGEAGPAKEDSPPAGGSNAFGAGCAFVDLTKDSE